MRFTLLLFLSFFIQSALYAQNQILDSLHAQLLHHTEDDTSKVSLLNALSANTWGADPHKAKAFADQALEIARKLKYTLGIADAYREISRYYWTQTEYDKSTDFALMALKEYERCNNPVGISTCYANIGTSYSQANNFDKALYYHNLALTLNRKINNPSGIARNLNSLGYVNELLKNYTLALDYYQQGLDIRIGLGSLVNKGDLTLSYSNVGSIYFYLKKYPLALEYLLKALPLALEINNKNYIALIYQNIGEVYSKTGKYVESEIYLKKALVIGTEIGDKKRREGVYEALIALEQTRKNYEHAFQYLELLQGIRDTLYTQDRSRQMARMETLYETEKKEQTIQLLEQEHRIQTLWRNVLAVAILLVIVVTVIIYRLQQSRTKKAKELLEFQQSVNEKLQEVDKIKSHFFANISHEFRTPLTLLLAPIEQKLLMPDIPSREKDSLLLMRRNANRLLDLVNQLLDLSKLEAGKMKLSIKRGDLGGFLNVLAVSFDSLSDYKKINFIKRISLADQEYWYDADILEKILNNLLSNAFKFTPAHGTVTLTVQRSGQKLQIQIQDTGRGIPKEEQAEIFSPFYQVSTTVEDGQAGTGLGLSFVKELVKLYAGTIELVSDEKSGTRISVSIPVLKEDFSIDQLSNEMTTQHPKVRVHALEHTLQDILDETPDENSLDVILVVEDNADLRNFIVSFLEKEYTVLTASNGTEGIRQAMEHIPSLILSDLMMPGADGIALTHEIKAHELTNHIPVILLTAKNEQESKLDGLRTGADDYLTKPFSTEELRIRIANLIRQRKQLAAKYQDQSLTAPGAIAATSLDDKFLQKVCTLVEANMGEFSFSVEKMAHEMHFSRTQLLRKLKALTGLSPNEFIKDQRLKRASEMILAKTDTIAQIGYAVGFNDQSYFTKCFKKQFGVSPTEYAASGKFA